MQVSDIQETDNILAKQEQLLIQEERYIVLLKKRFVAFWEIQSRVLNVVIMILLFLNIAIYTDMFTLIQKTFFVPTNVAHTSLSLTSIP
jgi:hypothetical protein